ncbi:MAG: MBL fold metallo-hydrolase [Deltaproteobacteria bacterium]|nr:MBL fold metallo-hydrolase [Deltaproteobacteria bacterium]
MWRCNLFQAAYRFLAFSLFFVLFLPRVASAFCHEIELVRSRPRFIPVAASSRTMTIEWLGHAAFLLTSSQGTKILMDPHGKLYPPPAISPHVITTSHLHGNHSFIWMATGNPIVLHGLTSRDGNWNRIHRTIRDVSIYTVPAYHDSQMGLARGKNAVFVVSMDGICVAHLGDLGHLLSESQLKMMGKIEVLLVPLGQGGFRITSEDAAKVVAQVKPKIAIPHHYRWESYVEKFTQIFPQVRKVKGNLVKLSRDTLNPKLEIIVLQDSLRGSQD